MPSLKRELEDEREEKMQYVGLARDLQTQVMQLEEALRAKKGVGTGAGGGIQLESGAQTTAASMPTAEYDV
jgi:hypothetical protein